MDRHRVENLLAKINMGWGLYKEESDESLLKEVQNSLEELSQLLEESS